jgi:hypothetical protein
MSVRVIVSGARHLHNYDDPMMRIVIQGLIKIHGGRNVTIVHGAARGVDESVELFAKKLGIETEPHPYSDFGEYGRAGGHMRNLAMLDAGADLVVAFKNDFNWALDKGGTEDMVRQARDAGVPVYVIQQVVP